MIAPQSMEMMSPSLRTTSSDGMPWTTTSFTEVQIVAGKPPYPRKFGFASCSASTLRATWSRSLVVAPGTAASRVAAWIAATTSPASRILAICSGVLICTMGATAFLDRRGLWTHSQRYGAPGSGPSGVRGRGGGDRSPRHTRRPRPQTEPRPSRRQLLAVVVALQRFQRPLRDLVHRAEGRDRDDQALRLVVVDDR